MKKVSIIIVTWNSAEFIYDCINSIIQRTNLDKEIIVIDNNSQDKTVQIVSENFSEVILVSNKDNHGFTLATNQGIEKSSGDFILLLNPDTVIKDDAIEKLRTFLIEHPQVGCVAPQILNFDNTIQASCRSFPSQTLYLWEFTGLSRIFPKHRIFSKWKMGYFDHKRTMEVDQPMGACLMIKREVLDAVGLLDDNFFMFYSDVDLCYRIKKAGWKIFFYADANIYHHLGASVKKAKRAMILSAHRSAYDFLKKHNIGCKSTLPMVKVLIYLSAYIRIIFGK